MAAKWNEVAFAFLEELRSSRQTQTVPRDAWMPWVQGMDGVRGVWGHGWSELRPTSSGRSDVVGAVGQAWVIRDDPGDALPLNCYRYVFIEMQDGTVWQHGPHKGGNGVSHHLDEVPSWATQY